MRTPSKPTYISSLRLLDSSILHFSFMLSLRPREHLPNNIATGIWVIIIVIVIILILYCHSRNALCISRRTNQAPKAPTIQAIHSVHTVSTFLRIRTDLSVLIFWVAITVALRDTLLMFSSILFFIVPSAPLPKKKYAPTTTLLFTCHMLCISS